MNAIIFATLQVSYTVLDLYNWVLIVTIIFNWLLAFNVINYSNSAIRIIASILFKVTEPILGKIRRYLPTIPMIDISPLVLFLLIYFLKSVIVYSLTNYM